MTSIFVGANSNQEVTNPHEVRSLVVFLVVCRALKLVIDPGTFIDREHLFDHSLVQVHLRTNQLWPRSTGSPCASLVDDKHIEITVTPVTACVECCKRQANAEVEQLKNELEQKSMVPPGDGDPISQPPN
jgi:hypothetical protein